MNDFPADLLRHPTADGNFDIIFEHNTVAFDADYIAQIYKK